MTRERRLHRSSRRLADVVPRALAVVAIFLCAGQIGAAETDTTASKAATARDPALRWEFDTGG
jgi:hypothetical protein